MNIAGKLDELMKIASENGEVALDRILDHARAVTKEPDNDYALAKLLNEKIFKIADAYYNIKDAVDTTSLNDAYTLLAHELNKLYFNNKKLTDIKPSSIFSWVRTLQGDGDQIREYWTWSGSADDTMHNIMEKHIAEVNRLWLIYSKKKPATVTNELQTLLDESQKALDEYIKVGAKLGLIETSDYLPQEYELEYDIKSGIIYVNGFKIHKAQASGSPAKLLEQAFKNQGVLFKPDLGSNRRSISSILNDVGIGKYIRPIFFTHASDKNGVYFRPLVDRRTLNSEGIDTTKLDDILRKNNVPLRERPPEDTPIDLSQIPF